MSRRILALVDDLFFVAKMQEAARRAGVDLVLSSSTEDLLERAKSGADLVILDLNDPSTDALGSIRALRSEPDTARIPVLGFVSHVQTERIEQARSAGCDQVLPRSQFSARLVDILRGAFRPA